MLLAEHPHLHFGAAFFLIDVDTEIVQLLEPILQGFLP